MSRARFITLLALVIGAAGLTVWLGWLAMQTGQAGRVPVSALLPLLLLAAIALRALSARRGK